MSRRAKPQGHSVAPSPSSNAPEPSSARPSSTQPLPAPTSKFTLRLIVIVAVAWLCTLTVMALLTANPHAISRDQVARADAVVIGRRIDPKSDRIKIERVLAGKLDADSEITVLNLNDVARVDSDANYLLPLSFFRQDYRVTTLEGQQVPPLAYPATPEYIDQVKQALRDAK